MAKQPAPIDKVFRVCVAQLRPSIGDVTGNLEKARQARGKAAQLGADIVIFPPLFISGNPLQDLWLQQDLVARCQAAIDELVHDTGDGGPAVLLFCVPDMWGDEDEAHCRDYLLDGGVCYPGGNIVDIRGLKIGIFSCLMERLDKASFVINVEHHHPYQRGRPEQRVPSAQRQIAQSKQPLIQINQLGGQDGLVFDGGSFALQPDGHIAFQMPHFAESVSLSEWEKTASGWWCRVGEKHDLYQGEAADYHACMMGLRDYVNHNGFDSVILGLSGGVDSALVAALAVDALGLERVRTVMLPYHYTSADSLTDAQECARLLGCNHQTISIADPVEGFLSALAPAFEGMARDVTEENLQSRARGTLLMALSNKFGALLLTTGNKSEGAVGYATLYGDMCGGFNPIKDLYKKHVYALCNWRNNNHPAGALGPKTRVIPQNILDKAPSAELRDNQKDEDTLPPYPVLDAILEALIEERKSAAQLIAEGFDACLVKRVEHLLYGAEYKRRQSAPGIKVSPRSFDHDWHMPLNHRFRLV